MSNFKFFCINFLQELFISSVLFSPIVKKFQNKIPAGWIAIHLELLKLLDKSIATFFVLYSLQLSNFDGGFNRLLDIIPNSNLDDKLPNGNVLKLLFLLLLAPILLLKSSNKSKTTLFRQKIGAIGFNGWKELFMPGIPSSILLSIMSFKLSL